MNSLLVFQFPRFFFAFIKLCSWLSNPMWTLNSEKGILSAIFLDLDWTNVEGRVMTYGEDCSLIV